MASGTVSMPDAGTPDRLDSHLHLWELGEGRYSWLQPAHGVLYSSFTAAQAHSALTAAGVGEAILVQAEDSVGETEEMLAAAESNPWIVGVVGWLPLENPLATASLLDTWSDRPSLCGIRSLIHEDPRAELLELPAVRQSLGLIAGAGLAFDIPDAFPRHLGQAAAVAHDLPALTVVLDHLGKPPRGGTAEEFSTWERQLRAVAALPNTVAKVSGLNCDGAEFSAGALERAWNVALSAFGPERLMFGGDWPVSLLGAPYTQTVSVLTELIGSLTPAESGAIWAGTARQKYRR